MDPIASGRNLLSVDPQPAADVCPPWLADRLDDLLQEMELLNTWLIPAPDSDLPATTMQSSPTTPDSPDLYCGDTQPSYYTPTLRAFRPIE